MKIHLISLLVALALVSALPALAAEADAEIAVNNPTWTLNTIGPIIAAQDDGVPAFGAEEKPIRIDRERVIMTRDYEEPSARPAFCDYDYEPRGGPSLPPAEFVPPC